MRFPIDLVYVSVDGTVVKTCSGIQPFQFSLGGKQAHSALELPAGFLSRKPITVGEKLVVGPAGYKAGQSSAEELARIPHLAQTSDAVNRQLSCFSSRYMNLLAVFQISYMQ